MSVVGLDNGWQDSARSGSPDFLLEVRAGAVSWSRLWEFYREEPADPGAMLALIGFFHAAHSRRYEREGSVVDADGKVYQPLQEWARFVTGKDALFPEVRLRESLAGLLGLSLITPLYYELVFSVYLEALLEREWATRAEDAPLSEGCQHRSVAPPSGRMVIRFPAGARARPPAESFSLLMAQHYPGWDQAFCTALGDEGEERFEEGGEG